MSYVRVMIPGVGEWSQRADKSLRVDVGEVLVPDSEHEAPYRDYPEPLDESRPLPDVPRTDPAPSGARAKTTKREH
jgi:hypothetical protein